jgi:diketogulonate reductase-like aldo/keto reductase
VASIVLNDPSRMLNLTPASVATEEVGELIRNALHWTGLDRFDVLLLSIPPSPSHFSPRSAQFADVVKALEAEVAVGRVGSYGFGAPKFTAIDGAMHMFMKSTRYCVTGL